MSPDEPLVSLDDDASDAAANRIEHGWFSALRAAKAMQSECAALREVWQAAEEAWRQAHFKLAQLENLRDSLAQQLDEMHGKDHDRPKPPSARAVKSAA